MGKLIVIEGTDGSGKSTQFRRVKEHLAPADGVFTPLVSIGAQVHEGDIAAMVDGVPMVCTLTGVLRGILAEGTCVHAGMKAGDIDPRCKVEHCYTASDKALSVGGGVLEALLHLRNG